MYTVVLFIIAKGTPLHVLYDRRLPGTAVGGAPTRARPVPGITYHYQYDSSYSWQSYAHTKDHTKLANIKI